MSDRSRKRLRTIIVVLASAALVLPAAAWAGHQFTDVSNSNIFHDDIDWMKDNDVTRGCNPPANDEYCPEENITRQEMAAFLHRLDTENVFVRPGDDAVDGGNADMVDGMHASDFLGATEQAVDSDLLDGMDSSAFVPSAQVLPFTVTFDSPGEKTIATSGPLSMVAVCDEGDLDGEGDGADQNLVVEYRSTDDDWIQGSAGLLGSGDTHGLLNLTVTDDSSPGAGTPSSSGGARSADGYYLGQDDYHSIGTLNHGGHLCVVSGVVYLQGPPA